MRIYKDYEINDGKLVKRAMQHKHLLYMPPYKGTPAIDKTNVWDKYSERFESIEFVVVVSDTEKTVFRSSKANFEANSVLVDLGWGKQLAMAKDYWDIEQKHQEGML